MNSLLWLAAVGSTLAWAGFDALRKGLVQKVGVVTLSFWICVAQLPGYIIWIYFEGASGLQPGYWLPALASIGLNLVANLVFLEAMRIAPLSVAIPILSFTPVFVAISGGPLLGEHLTGPQWAGVAMVVVGALALTAQPGQLTDPQQLVRAFVTMRGVRLMLWVALFWALTPICDKLALRHASIGLHGLVLALGVGLGMLVFILASGGGHQLMPSKSSWGLLTAGGVTNVVALGLQMVAISGLVVSLFEAFKRAAELILSMVVGAFFFHERLSWTKAAAALLMGTGLLFVLVPT